MSEKTQTIKLRKQGDLYECEIDGDKYDFRIWTWGEKNKVTEQCTRVLPSGQQKLEVGEFNLCMLLATLKKAPFKIDRATIESYPNPKLIDLLIRITTKLNLLEDVEIKNLS